MPSPTYAQDLIDKIRALPEDKIAEVAAFVELLRSRSAERDFAVAVTRVSERAFEKVWDNPDDAEYDEL